MTQRHPYKESCGSKLSLPHVTCPHKTRVKLCYFQGFGFKPLFGSSLIYLFKLDDNSPCPQVGTKPKESVSQFSFTIYLFFVKKKKEFPCFSSNS